MSGDWAPNAYQSASLAPLAPPPPAPVWPVFAGLAAACVATVAIAVSSTGLVAAVVAARTGARLVPLLSGPAVQAFARSAEGVLAVALSASLAFTVVPIVAASFSSEGVGARLRAGTVRGGAATFVAAAVLAAGTGYASFFVTLRAGGSATGTVGALRRLANVPDPRTFALAVLVAAVGGAVAEELFVRGFALGRIEKRLPPPLANLAVAAAFALAHSHGADFLLSLPPGLAMGWAAQRAGSVRCTIVAQALAHTALLCVLRAAPAVSPGYASVAFAVIAAGVGAFGLAASASAQPSR